MSRRSDRGTAAETLAIRVEAFNGCVVFYEVAPFALILTPSGARYRAPVNERGVELVIMPPTLDLDWIARLGARAVWGSIKRL